MAEYHQRTHRLMAWKSLVDALSQPAALAHILASLDSRGVANLRQLCCGVCAQTRDASAWFEANLLRFPERLRDGGLNHDSQSAFYRALRLHEYLTAQAPLPHPLSRGGALLTVC